MIKLAGKVNTDRIVEIAVMATLRARSELNKEHHLSNRKSKNVNQLVEKNKEVSHPEHLHLQIRVGTTRRADEHQKSDTKGWFKIKKHHS
jgi:hypothetical protein